MTMPQAPKPLSGEHELLNTVRAYVSRISTETGLPEPAVRIVQHSGSGKPSINARFIKRKRVPMIKITERAVRELSPAGLRFLLTHEFGHFAIDKSWAPVHRWLIAAYFLGSVLLLAVVFGGLVAEIRGEAGPGFIVLAVGAIVFTGALLGSRAHSRNGERQADRFAAIEQGHVSGAQDFFAALENDKPEKIPHSIFWRRANLLWRSHPYHSMRHSFMLQALNHDGQSLSESAP